MGHPTPYGGRDDLGKGCMMGSGSGPSWRFPVGASLCGIGGVGNPMPMDFLGGHTLGSVTFSAVALGLFLAATVWMFRRWGEAGGAPEPIVLEDESEAIWMELEERSGRETVTAEPDTQPDTKVGEPV